MRVLFTLCVIHMIGGVCLGQRYIEGTVLDQLSQQPVEYAHVVFLSNQKRGSFSNQLGQFKLLVSQEMEQDTLVISQIGYKTLRLPLAELSEEGIISMEANTLVLNTVKVLSEEILKDIFSKAIERIPENYGTKKYWLDAYYQEYSISDSAYSEIIESFITIQDRPYLTTNNLSMIRVLAMRKSDDQRHLPDYLMSSEVSQLYDIYEKQNNVRNRRFHLMSRNPESLFKYFRFYYLGEYQLGRDTMIRIGFNYTGSSVKLRQKQFAHGEVTINKSDYGIVKVRRGVSMDGGFHEATYKKLDGKYYPHKIFHIGVIRFQENKRFYLQSRQLHIFGLTPEKDRKNGQKLPRDQNLRALELPYDKAFWQDHAILVPVSAPKALTSDLSKIKSLEEQFESNAHN